ncbi:JNK-interacting protein 3 isoform X3 [Aphis craccivora]|uniref:JNK-interacting protein 3 isoform X3 n=1 Tax=Aphis craccivora TaxID=307492 RepID=A0A6G0ZLF6_APHCR|nr:JNK-interacting protein 3 isoform X3 [Aphis craccivora]
MFIDSSNILNGCLDEQGDGDYFDRTEKNQLFLWGVHSEAKSKDKYHDNDDEFKQPFHHLFLTKERPNIVMNDYTVLPLLPTSWLGHTHPSLDKESGPTHRKTLNMSVKCSIVHQGVEQKKKKMTKMEATKEYLNNWLLN